MRSCAGLALLVAAAATCSRGHREAAPEAAARDYLTGLGERFTPKELADTTMLMLKDKAVTDEGLPTLRASPSCSGCRSRARRSRTRDWRASPTFPVSRSWISRAIRSPTPGWLTSASSRTCGDWGWPEPT